MSSSRKYVWIGLAIAVVLDVGAQVAWKASANTIPTTAHVHQIITTLAGQPMTYVLIAMFLAQFVNWMLVLGRADLSYAQPITASSYVLIAICSMKFLHEPMPMTRWAGIALILVGVFLISRTKHKTTGAIAP